MKQTPLRRKRPLLPKPRDPKQRHAVTRSRTLTVELGPAAVAVWKARTPLKKVNTKRRKSEFARAYGSPARVAWVRSLPCVCLSSRCAGEIENAHIATGGVSRKADARYVVPLCHAHHGILHRVGYATFERAYLIDLKDAAARTEAAWQATCTQEDGST